jgi:hypothetical protein
MGFGPLADSETLLWLFSVINVLMYVVFSTIYIYKNRNK